MFLITEFGFRKKKKNREVEILDLLQRSYLELRDAEKDDGQRQKIASQQELMMIKWSSFDFL